MVLASSRIVSSESCSLAGLGAPVFKMPFFSFLFTATVTTPIRTEKELGWKSSVWCLGLPMCSCKTLEHYPLQNDAAGKVTLQGVSVFCSPPKSRNLWVDNPLTVFANHMGFSLCSRPSFGHPICINSCNCHNDSEVSITIISFSREQK